MATEGIIANLERVLGVVGRRRADLVAEDVEGLFFEVNFIWCDWWVRSKLEGLLDGLVVGWLTFWWLDVLEGLIDSGWWGEGELRDWRAVLVV